LALIFAWAFELTPEGLKKEKDIERSESITHVTGRKLDFVIIGLLVVALGYFGYDKFVLDPDRDAVKIEAAVQVAREEAASAVEPRDSAKSIAVLAFADLSPEGDQEYFCDGISEEILNLLVKIPELRVTSRSSAFSFKGQKLDVPTMAARLNVAHVLEGSVRKSGNQLRITAQLIEAATDTHLWSETYDRELENIFAIQDEIAAAVVDVLKITLLGNELKATETNPEAYTLYLQGRHFRIQNTVDSYEQAETLLKQALDIDPRYAPAWSELGNVYNDQTNRFGLRPVDEAHKLARRAIQKALDIDPQYGRAWADLGDLEIHYSGDFTAADQHMRKALALNPGDTIILWNVAHLDDVLGRIDESIDVLRQSIALDPLSPGAHRSLGRMYYRAHRLEEAADSLRLGLSLTQDRSFAQYYIGLVLLAQGDATAALVAIEQETLDYLRLTGTAIVQYVLGDAGASDAALEALIDKHGEDSAYLVAMVYAFRDEIDLAFDWLDRAYNKRDTGLPFMLLEPFLANLHDDPRWTDFLEKMGLPH
jgi:TolB-like protein/Tfp pilus assembly protein PilF